MNGPKKTVLSVLAGIVIGGFLGTVFGHPDNREKAKSAVQHAGKKVSAKISELRNRDED